MINELSDLLIDGTVYKSEVFENEKVNDGDFVVKNFMFHEQALALTSSTMTPVYKRSEFMGLLLLLQLTAWCIFNSTSSKRNSI